MASPERSGVVLAGGYSTRFGPRDKALALFDGEPMLARVVRRLATVVDDVVVSCRADQHERFEEALDGVAASAGLRFAHDPTPDQGPLAALATTFEGIRNERTAVVACDMPWFDPEFLSLLFERYTESTAVVPEHPDGHLRPTQAVYRSAAMRRAANEQVAAGNRSLHAALDTLDTTTIPAETVTQFTDAHTLDDVNTTADLNSLERKKVSDGSGFCGGNR